MNLRDKKIKRTQKKRQKQKLRDNNSIGVTVQKRRQPSKNLRDKKRQKEEEKINLRDNNFTRQKSIGKRV